MDTIVVDRRGRAEEGTKSRQRFLDRTREAARKAINQDINSGKSIKDFGEGGIDVTVPKRGLSEPSFRNGKGGIDQRVLPGNKKYVVNDTIERPQGGGGGRGSEGSPDGDGEDDFVYHLSKEEYINLVFEDLELPNMHKVGAKDDSNTTLEEAGYAHSGTFNRLSLVRSKFEKTKREIFMGKKANEKALDLLGEEKDILSRYGSVAPAAGNVLKFEKPSTRTRVKILEAEVRDLKKMFLGLASPEEKARIADIDAELAPLAVQKKSIGRWRENSDLRFRAVEEEPHPTSQAVMFCEMDVSGSMTEEMKANAKLFYILLYRFLNRKYDKVDVVFVRHTHVAKEVDEQEFFESPETGGTMVSTAHEEIVKIQKQRYDEKKWNIYVAQASDGDNTTSDNDKTVGLMKSKILPVVQGYFYLEVGRDTSAWPGYNPRESDLWQAYKRLEAPYKDVFWMKKAGERKDIVPVFREFLKKRPQSSSAAGQRMAAFSLG